MATINRIPVSFAISTTVDSKTGVGSFIANLTAKGKTKKLSGIIPEATSNEMPIIACIEAVKALKSPCEVAVYTTSNYMISIASAFRVWRERGLKTKEGKPMANVGAWMELFNTAAAGHHKLTFHYATELLTAPSQEESDAVQQAKAIAAQVDPSIVNEIEKTV